MSESCLMQHQRNKIRVLLGEIIMMTKIKHVLAFLWGVFFASCIWIIVALDTGEFAFIPIVGLIFSGIGLLFMIVGFFATYWNSE